MTSPVGRPTDYKEEYCQIVVGLLASGESLAGVCAELDICRETLTNWRKSNPEFDASIKRGLQKAQRTWEKIGKDGVMGNLEKFSAPAWIFTMKNRFKEDYKEDKESKSVNESLVEKLLDRLID